MEMVQAVCEAKHHTAIVLATGGGKSLSYILPPLLEPTGITLVIIPLVALLSDIRGRMRSFPSIKWSCWPNDFNGSSRDMASERIIFFQVEHASSRNGAAFISQLVAAKLVKRVIIDEAHQVLTASHYRQSMNDLSLLSQFPVPIFLLTATLAPHSQNELAVYLGIPPPSLHTIRAPSTVRDNIHIEVNHLAGSKQDLLMEVTSLMNGRFKLTPGKRGLVFIPSVQTGRDLSKLTGWDFYTAQDDPIVREGYLQKFKASDASWLLGTCGLGQGVDLSNISTVIHCGSPFDFTGYVQEMGRAGRDGSPATAFMLYTSPRIHKRAQWNIGRVPPDLLDI